MPPTERGAGPHPSRSFDTSTALFLLAALIFLYSLLFLPPFVPIQFLGDGLLYLTQGQRMYQGEMIYRDFLEFVTPGIALINLSMFKLFGLRTWIPNLLSLLLGMGLVWLGVVIAKRLMRPSMMLLPSALFLVGVHEFLCDPTHHWYSLLTVTAAIAAVMEGRTLGRIAAAGALCGLAACFTQSRGLAVVVGFGVFLWWESRRREEGWRTLRRKEAWLAGSFLAILVAVSGYFIGKAGPARFFWCTVVFVLKYYPKMAELNTFLPAFRESWPEFYSAHFFLESFLRWLFLYVLVPSTYLLVFFRYGRQSGEKPTEYWVRPMLLAIAGSCMFLSVAPAPLPYRMASASLPGFILLCWFIDCPRRLARTIAGVLVAGVLLVAPHAAETAQSLKRQILTVRPGKLAVADPNYYQEYTWIQQHTRQGEYFYAAVGAELYFYEDLRNPTPLPFIGNCGYTTPEQVAEVIQGLERHRVHYIYWSPAEMDIIPEWEDPSDDHLGPLREYIRNHYQVVKVFRNRDLIWEKATR